MSPDAVIPFHKPSIGDAEVAAAVEVLHSGWLTTGPKSHELEQAFATRVGARHALAVNSATAALHLALDGMGVGPGDAVAVPTTTFTACGEVCAYLGADVRLTDVGADFLMGPGELERAAKEGTQAVMPVHFGGLTVDVGALRQVLPSAKFIEDAAHALPASVGGISTGSLGDAAAFSFYATKTMTTGGEGGMLTTDDDELAARARLMRLHGMSTDSWNRYGVGGSWYYEVIEAGFKYNLTDLAAAIGLVQLARLDELHASRQSIAERYDSAFGSSEFLEVPQRRDGDVHAWHLYVIRLNLAALRIDRNEVIRRLGQAGVGSSVHFIPLHLQPYYQRRYGYMPGDFPVAESLFERSISLPIWPGMTPVQVDRVAATMLDICRSGRRVAEARNS